MNEQQAKLEQVVTTSPTTGMGDLVQPMEVKPETPLEDITKHYDTLAGKFNLMGENLARDVDARQQLLIGNDYTNNDGSEIGAYNYQRYYPQPLASGANQISIIGKTKALNEGMTRAEEAAKQRVKNAQDRYNRYQQAKAAEAARQAQAAQQAAIARQNANMSVSTKGIDPELLKKHGISAADLANMDPATRAKTIGKITDQSTGISGAYNSAWNDKSNPNSAWARTVNTLYEKYGATGATRDDEFSGPAGQSAENKAFWKRKDVSEDFGKIFASMTGYGDTYYENRATYVNAVNNNIQRVLDTGGSLDQVINSFKDIKMTYSAPNYTSNIKQLAAIPEQVFYAQGANVDASSFEQFKVIAKAAREAVKSSGNIDDTFASKLEEAGYKGNSKDALNLSGNFLSSNNLRYTLSTPANSDISKFHLNNKAPIDDSKELNFDFDAWKKGLSAPSQTKELSGNFTLEVIRDVLQFTPQEMIAIHKWKTEDSASFDDTMNTLSMAMNFPIVVSDGNMTDGNGNKVPAGEILFYIAPGMENFKITQELQNELKKRVFIDENGTPQFGEGQLEEINKKYADYVLTLGAVQNMSNVYGLDGSNELASAVQYLLAKKRGLSDTVYEQHAEGTSASKLAIRDTKIDDIVKKWNSLSGKERGEAHTFLIKAADFKGANELISGNYNLHGLFSDDISKSEAEAILTLVNAGRGKENDEGFLYGHTGDVKNFLQGASDSFVSAADNSLEFITGVGKMVAGSAAGLFTFGNAGEDLFTEGSSQVFGQDKFGNESKYGDYGLSNDVKIREEDNRLLENLSMYTGMDNYLKDAWRGTGHIAGGFTEFMAELALTGGIKTLIKTGASRLAGSLMRNSADDVARVVAGQAADDAASAGAKVAASYTDDTAKAGVKAISGSDDTIKGASSALSSVDNLSGKAFSEISTESGAGVIKATAKSSLDDIFKAAGGSMLPDNSPLRSVLMESSARAKYIALGLSEDVVSKATNWTLGAATAISNSVGDDMAVDFIKKAVSAQTVKGSALTRKEVLRVLADNVDELGKSAKGLARADKLLDEAKETVRGMAHSIHAGNGGLSQVYGYDSNGNLDTGRPFQFVGQEIAGDILFGVAGAALKTKVGRPLAANVLKVDASRLNNKLAKIDIDSPSYTKTIARIDKRLNLANSMMNNAQIEFKLRGNSPKYNAAKAQVAEITNKITDNLTESMASKLKIDTNKSYSIDQLYKHFDDNMKPSERAYRSIVVSKLDSIMHFNKLSAEMPDLVKLDASGWANIKKSYYESLDSFKVDDKINITPNQEIDALRKAMIGYGLPKVEVDTYLKYRNEFNISQMKKGGLDNYRTSYFPVGHILEPAEIKAVYKGNAIANHIGVLNPKKARDTMDARTINDSIVQFLASGNKMNDYGGIELGGGIKNADVDLTSYNPVLELMYQYNTRAGADLQGRIFGSYMTNGDIVGVMKHGQFDSTFNIEQNRLELLNQQLETLDMQLNSGDLKVIDNLHKELLNLKNISGADNEAIDSMVESVGTMMLNGYSTPESVGALIRAAGGIDSANEFIGRNIRGIKDLDDAFESYYVAFLDAIKSSEPRFKDGKGRLYADVADSAREVAMLNWIDRTGHTPSSASKTLDQLKKENPIIKHVVYDDEYSRAMTLAKFRDRRFNADGTPKMVYVDKDINTAGNRLFESVLREGGYASDTPKFPGKSASKADIDAYNANYNSWKSALKESTYTPEDVSKLKSAFVDKYSKQYRVTHKFKSSNAAKKHSEMMFNRYLAEYLNIGKTSAKETANVNGIDVVGGYNVTRAYDAYSPSVQRQLNYDSDLSLPEAKWQFEDELGNDALIDEDSLLLNKTGKAGANGRRRRMVKEDPRAWAERFFNDPKYKDGIPFGELERKFKMSNSAINDTSYTGKDFFGNNAVHYFEYKTPKGNDWKRIKDTITFDPYTNRSNYDFIADTLFSEARLEPVAQRLREGIIIDNAKLTSARRSTSVNNIYDVEALSSALSDLGADESIIKQILDTNIRYDDIGKRSGRFDGTDLILNKSLNADLRADTLSHELTHRISRLLYPDEHKLYMKNFYRGNAIEAAPRAVGRNTATRDAGLLAEALSRKVNEMKYENSIFDTNKRLQSDLLTLSEKIKAAEDAVRAIDNNDMFVTDSRILLRNSHKGTQAFNDRYVNLYNYLQSNNNKLVAGTDIKAIVSQYDEAFKSGLDSSLRNIDGVYINKDIAETILKYHSTKTPEKDLINAVHKIGDIMNNIHQAQLAAGFGRFNAYTSIQVRDALMATFTRDPIGSLKLLSAYTDSKNMQSMKEFYTNPRMVSFLSNMAAVTGDHTLLDAMSDAVSSGAFESTGALGRMLDGYKEAITLRHMDNNGIPGAIKKGTLNMLDNLFEDPTFRRMIPILQTKQLELEYSILKNKLIRKQGSVLAGDEDKLMKDAYEAVMRFWDTSGGISPAKRGLDQAGYRMSKAISGEKKPIFLTILDSFVFARGHQQNMISRPLNAIFAVVNPKTWGDSRYSMARGYAASFLGLVALAQSWNYITDQYKDGNEQLGNTYDSNDLWSTLSNLGGLTSFKVGNKKIDAMFSTFTMPNRLMKTGLAISNNFLAPEDRFPGVQDWSQEAGSFLMSPWKTAQDIAFGNYYGYSVWGKNAHAIDPDTGEPIGYDPGKDFIAIMSYALGLNGLTNNGYNERGENITGGGLFRHAYIDAVREVMSSGDAFTAIATALELPLKNDHDLNQAKAELNSHVKEAIISYYKEYQKEIEGANIATKDEAYKKFTAKALEQVTLWNKRHKVLSNNPETIRAAQKILMAFLSDEVSPHDYKIMTGYWKAGIDKLGGFDKREDETDEQYQERRKIVNEAYNRQMDVEYKARQTLRQLGFDPIGYKYPDSIAQQKESKSNMLAQFKSVLEGKVDGYDNMKSVKEEYQDMIQLARNRGDWNGAKALEREYINKLDGVLAPYIDKYGRKMLINNYEAIDMIKPLVLIPSDDGRKYLSDNRNRNWLLDHYQIGYKDSSKMISDDKYVDTYNRILRDTLGGKVNSAVIKIEDTLQSIANGKYTPSADQYNQLIQLYTKLKRR